MSIPVTRNCWCGNDNYEHFSQDYKRCLACQTLVAVSGLASESLVVNDDDHDFYGKNYWLAHQTDELGYRDIFLRMRQDLPERCTYWLRTLVRYVLPPGRILELGCAHGGFVALAKLAGFEATGLEMSPWIVQFAQHTFDIPVLKGPLESQQLEPRSFNAIVLYDVLEHLDQPLITMQRCVDLLTDDGVIIIQTPRFPSEKNYETLNTESDPFLDHLEHKSSQHLYLFSTHSAHALLRRAGFLDIVFEDPIFDYDMYIIAGKQPLHKNVDAAVVEALQKTPYSRFALALIDSQQLHEDLKGNQNRLQDHIKSLNQHIRDSSVDYDRRLQIILDQQQQIDLLAKQVHELSVQLAELSKDSDMRLAGLLEQQKIVAHQQEIITRQDEFIIQQQYRINEQDKELTMLRQAAPQEPIPDAIRSTQKKRGF